MGWGIAWYINGLLIPEIYVVRGKTYTFVVEGGQNPNSPAAYHPFYITDDPEGGYQFKTPEQKKAVSCLTFYGPFWATLLSYPIFRSSLKPKA